MVVCLNYPPCTLKKIKAKPMRNLGWLGKINILSSIEPIREGVRKNNLTCKFVMQHFQSPITNGYIRVNIPCYESIWNGVRRPVLPKKVKMQYVHFRLHAHCFLFKKKKQKKNLEKWILSTRKLMFFDGELFRRCGQNLCPSNGMRMTWGQYADRPRKSSPLKRLVDKTDFSSVYTNPRWMRVYTLLLP